MPWRRGCVLVDEEKLPPPPSLPITVVAGHGAQRLWWGSRSTVSRVGFLYKGKCSSFRNITSSKDFLNLLRYISVNLGTHPRKLSYGPNQINI